MDFCTIQTSGIHTALTKPKGHDQPSNKRKPQNFSSNKEGFMGKVIVGSKQEPLCIPKNSTITVSGAIKRPLHGATCLVEQAIYPLDQL